MRLFFCIPFLTAALLGPAQGIAQITTVPVRGGEHAEYTRLAITLPSELAWQVQQDGTEVMLTITGGALRFDLSQTFARIPRTRLQSVQQLENGLVFRLNCDCPIRASEDLPQMLVLDILNPEGSIASLAANTPRPRPRPDLLRNSDLASRAGVGLAQQIRTPVPSAAAPDKIRFPAATVLEGMENVLIFSGANASAPQDMADARRDTLSSLGQSLSSAVGSGLLVAAASPALHNPATHGAETEISTSTWTKQVIVNDSITRARTSNLFPETTTQACPDPETLAIQNWGMGTTDQGKGADFSQIYDERDQVVSDYLRHTARDLLYHGFGLEAQLLLELIPSVSDEDALLMALGDIIDRQSEHSVVFPAAVETCGDMGALWAALAQLPEQFGPKFPLAQAIRGAALLPSQLRLHLGSYFLRHLLVQGHIDHARTLRDSLERVARDDRNPNLNSILSSVPGPGNDRHQVGRNVGDVTDMTTPEDVIFLLQQNAKSDTPLPGALVEAAQGYVYTLRGSDFGAKIGIELAVGFGRGGLYDQAFQMASSPDMLLSPAASRDLRTTLLDQLAANATDAEFLTLVFAADPWTTPVAADTMIRLAHRLEKLGFDTPAATLEDQANTQQYWSPSLSAHLEEWGNGRGGEMDATNAPQSEVPPAPPAPNAVGTTRTRAMPAPQPNVALETENVASSTPSAVRSDIEETSTGPQSTAISTPQIRREGNAETMISNTNLSISTTSTSPDNAPPSDSRLLAAGREALTQSAALRARIAATIPDP